MPPVRLVKSPVRSAHQQMFREIQARGFESSKRRVEDLSLAELRRWAGPFLFAAGEGLNLLQPMLNPLWYQTSGNS